MSTPPAYLDDATYAALALAIGTSLQAEENAAAFLAAVRAETPFQQAALWLARGTEARWVLSEAQPEGFAPAEEIPPGHPYLERARKDAFAVQAADTDLAPDDGMSLFFRIGERGLLLLRDPNRTEVLRKAERDAWQPLLRAFARSLSHCAAHAEAPPIDAEIAYQKRFYEQVLNEMPAHLAVFDTEARYVFITPSAVADPERRAWMLGKTDEDYARIRGLDPALGQQRTRLIRRVVAEKKLFEFEESFATKQGEMRHFRRFVSPVFDERGEVVQVLGFGVDVTEEQHAIAERRHANELAADTVRAKEQFIANMSHEMRTPLNAVIGLTHLLLDTDPTPTQQQYLQAIRYSADNLLVLINDILDFAKIEAGKLRLESVPFRLGEIVEGVAQTLRYRADERGLRLTAHIAPEVPAWLVGDALRLNQILLNLLTNAVKFTEEGEVRLRIQAVAVTEDSATLSFAVTDTGIGIAPEQVEQIFESFTQARSDTTRRYGGTGLGLTIVRELVRLHEGTLDVQSTVGEGTTFTLTLPYAIATPAQIAEREQEARGEAVDLTGARLLLVEDNPMNQLVARSMLAQWGATVDLADDGLAALDALQKAHYDLVLMDIQMPEMDGYDAARHIRQDLGFSSSQLPILALTASTLVDHKSDVEAAGMDDYILKPFDPARLRRRIAYHLGRTSVPAVPLAAPVAAPLFDLDLLERNALGDTAFVDRLIDLFFTQATDFVQEVTAAADGEDWAQVGFLAHKMKSSAGMFGAAALETALRTLEDEAKSGREVAGLPALVAEATRLTEAVAAALHAHVDAKK